MESPVAISKADEEKYEAEEDVRTMIRAGEIKADKPRLKRCMKMAKEQMAALKNVSSY